jgi:phosphinothricin acetyltransferase
MIRAATTADAGAVAEIYNHYIANTVVTFEEETLPASEIARRIEAVQSASLPWLVAEVGGQVAGYAYAGRWHARSAYRFSAEITVYLAPAQVGRGLGSKLYDELFPILRERGIHTVIGGIALPNEASVALHEKFGLAKVAHYEEVGFKFDRWIDVGYWQRIL